MALVFYPTKYQIPGLQSRHFHFLEVDQVCTFDRHVGREVLLQSESSPPIPIRIVIKKKKNEKLYFLLSHLYTWKQGLDLWSSIQARFTKLSLSYPYCCSDCISPNSRPAHCGTGMLSFSRLLALADPSPWNTLLSVIQCLAPWYSESLSLTPESKVGTQTLFLTVSLHSIGPADLFSFFLEQSLCIIYNPIPSPYNSAWHLVNAENHLWTNKIKVYECGLNLLNR